VAHRFHLDPVLVMDEPDAFRWAVRVAAAQRIGRDMAEQQKG